MAIFRFITFIVLLSFVSVLTFGVIMSMRVDDMGQMSDCPFSIGEILCQMGSIEHLIRFKQTFASIPMKLLVFALFVFLSWFLFGNKVRIFVQNNRLVYLKNINGLSHIFNNFISALSDGIIQPKLYA